MLSFLCPAKKERFSDYFWCTVLRYCQQPEFYLYMIRIFLFLAATAIFLPATAQHQPNQKFWVFLKDKKDVSFDPYTYFDAKAIADKQRRGLPINHPTDWPVNAKYVAAITQLSDSVTFRSRWFNAVVCYTSSEKASQISQLPFVVSVEQAKNWQSHVASKNDFDKKLNKEEERVLQGQLATMQSSAFAAKNIDGKGVRVAIFDAGFTSVDKNPAFEHIRRRNGIIKTRDFVRKRDHVYNYSSHGTMVLSCVGGIMDGKQIGLATGAEFLLARTERTLTEFYDEEENWLAAAEWAHQNGANVINSSLGYTYHRYFATQMNGRISIVEKAATMAAAKGILVVNSAGNEGSGDWKIIGVPAAADSVLSIGGVSPWEGFHTDFSSYGPTADKRMKPNVTAYGHVIASGPNGFTSTQGTSFSGPLVAGFAACAWQTNPNLKAMELFKEIEKSGNLYPYYDYAHGFGIPQAGYFAGEPQQTASTPQKDVLPFELIKTEYGVLVKVEQEFIPAPAGNAKPGSAPTNKTDAPLPTMDDYLYYHIENSRGYLDKYFVLKVEQPEVLKLIKSDIGTGKTVRVYYKGHTTEYKF